MRTFRAHPFATVLSDRIVALMLRMGHGQLAGQYPPAHTYGDDVRLRRNFHEKVTEYTRVLPHPSDGEVCKQFFGSEVPVGRLYTALMEVMQKNYGTPYAGEYHALPLNEALARVPAQKIERVRDQMVRQWETHSSKAVSAAAGSASLWRADARCCAGSLRPDGGTTRVDCTGCALLRSRCDSTAEPVRNTARPRWRSSGRAEAAAGRLTRRAVARQCCTAGNGASATCC